MKEQVELENPKLDQDSFSEKHRRWQEISNEQDRVHEEIRSIIEGRGSLSSQEHERLEVLRKQAAAIEQRFEQAHQELMAELERMKSNYE